MREPLHQLSSEIGYQFGDERLLEQALTHRSAAPLNNERFEFLGDAILGFVIASELYHRYPKANEGQLSRLRAQLVKRESLAELARAKKLGQFLNLGSGELRSGGQSRDSILADALEALFGAIYLDAGFDSASSVILSLYQEMIASLPADAQEKDPKTRLQEYLQSRRYELPAYTVVKISGEQHAQQFIVECAVSKLEMTAQGRGGSRRKAEQSAAAGLLKRLGVR